MYKVIEKIFSCICMHARGLSIYKHVTGSVVKVEARLEVSRVYFNSISQKIIQ